MKKTLKSILSLILALTCVLGLGAITVAAEDAAPFLAAALAQELELWKSGRRNPHAIAESWQPHFHVDKVFNKIFE